MNRIYYIYILLNYVSRFVENKIKVDFFGRKLLYYYLTGYPVGYRIYGKIFAGYPEAVYAAKSVSGATLYRMSKKYCPILKEYLLTI